MCKIRVVYGSRPWGTNGHKQRAILGIKPSTFWANYLTQRIFPGNQCVTRVTVTRKPWKPHGTSSWRTWFCCCARQRSARAEANAAMSLLYSSTQLVTKHGVISQFSGLPLRNGRTLDAALIKEKICWRFPDISLQPRDHFPPLEDFEDFSAH